MNTKQTSTDDLIEAPDLAVATGSGRATWDERGNSIWEWQTSPGVFSRDISSQQLYELQANELSLMDGAPDHEVTLWSRNARNTLKQRVRQATELVMPARREVVKTSNFDIFLKRLGLPA